MSALESDRSATDLEAVKPKSGDMLEVRARIESADEIFAQGLEVMEAGDLVAALVYFKDAHQTNPDSARIRSHLGVCLAIEERRFDRAIDLCSAAAKQEFFNPEVYVNLARVYLAFGFRNEGRRYLLRAKMIDPMSRSVEQALRELGARGEPVLRFLPRGHVLNRWLGSARHAVQWPRLAA
jgi:Flp pilus assembly protein TadD